MKELFTRLAVTTPIDEITGENVAGSSELKGNIIGIINAIIGILGIVAVIVIIIGGITYMTSSGDSSKVKKAKDTILYGIIGLVICILAFAIVNFVINGLINA